MIKLLVITVLSIAFVGCTSTEGKESILPSHYNIQEGDIVFRCGTSLNSEVVMQADEKGDYSHVGIVVNALGKLMVVHAVPDEPDFVGDIATIKMDSINSFFTKAKARNGAICRHKDSVLAKATAKYAIELYNRHLPFDEDFNASDTTKMYCTELIIFVYKKCGVRLVDSDGHKFYLPNLKYKVFLPSDIYNSKQLKLIKKF